MESVKHHTTLISICYLVLSGCFKLNSLMTHFYFIYLFSVFYFIICRVKLNVWACRPDLKTEKVFKMHLFSKHALDSLNNMSILFITLKHNKTRLYVSYKQHLFLNPWTTDSLVLTCFWYHYCRSYRSLFFYSRKRMLLAKIKNMYFSKLLHITIFLHCLFLLVSVHGREMLPLILSLYLQNGNKSTMAMAAYKV